MISVKPVSYGCEPPPSLLKRLARLVCVKGVCVGPKFDGQKSSTRKRKITKPPKVSKEKVSINDEGEHCWWA